MKSLKLTPANILNIGLILFIILLFFWKPCNKDSERIARIRAENEALKKEKHETDKDAAKNRQRFSKDSAEARGREQLAVTEKQESDNKVRQQQKTIDRLASVIRNSQVILDSSSAVLVSPHYKSVCDSLPNEIDRLNASLAQKDSAINQWTDVLAYEIQLRDSAIESEKGFGARWRQTAEDYGKLTQYAINAFRPRGRLLGGVGLIGNETNPLSGTKINLAYQSRGGKQYQVGGMLFKGGVYYEAGVLITLIK